MATADSTSSLDAFLARWLKAAASERANAQLYLTELTHLLDVPRPGNDHTAGYSFEFPVKIPIGPGAFFPFPFPACDEGAKARIRALGEKLDAHRKRVQAQHPGLSLTAMYNVLEALREGRELTAKEKAVHDQGLVSVLRQLHDDLDAAVAAAYGWSDLWHWLAESRRGTLYDFETSVMATLETTPKGFAASLEEWDREFEGEILRRLVALNAERAAEDAAGKFRWLRPEYQNPTGTSIQTGLAIASTTAKEAKTKVSKAKTPWPKSLAERVHAVERALQDAAGPVTAETLAKRFARAKPEDLAEILETLATLGRAHRNGEKFSS